MKQASPAVVVMKVAVMSNYRGQQKDEEKQKPKH
jgi:hypothetical protein